MKVLLTGLLATAAAAQAAAADGLDTPAEMIAAQVRDQGLPCEKTLGAKRETEGAQPDHAVWILRCSDASYRVRMTPDMSADIEPLNGGAPMDTPKPR